MIRRHSQVIFIVGATLASARGIAEDLSQTFPGASFRFLGEKFELPKPPPEPEPIQEMRIFCGRAVVPFDEVNDWLDEQEREHKKSMVRPPRAISPTVNRKPVCQRFCNH
jgi:hypothetical protein